MLKLYSYFRSSAAYRVRIALNFKGLAHEYEGVHLLHDGGRQRTPDFRAINPTAQVPAIDHDGFRLGESVAILQYLDQISPAPPLWPTPPRDRARVTQICELVNAGIQPLVNLKVTRQLIELGLTKDHVDRWTRHWLEDGLMNLNTLLRGTAGRYAFGDQITAADCFIVPQCFSARRMGLAIEAFDVLARVDAAARALEPFVRAEPARQPDHEP